MNEIIDLAVGFDQREAVAYHTFVQSVVEKSSIPVRFLPLNMNSLSSYSETHNDGSNDFIYSRFLVPFLVGFKGWVIYADGDMICVEDIKKLWNLRNDKKYFEPILSSSRNLAHWAHKNADSPVKNKVIPGLHFQTN